MEDLDYWIIGIVWLIVVVVFLWWWSGLRRSKDFD